MFTIPESSVPRSAALAHPTRTPRCNRSGRSGVAADAAEGAAPVMFPALDGEEGGQDRQPEDAQAEEHWPGSLALPRPGLPGEEAERAARPGGERVVLLE